MDRPVVCIVGRPNVGKSTLFNRITGKRIAITEDTPGVTRDRIYSEAEWLNKYFTLIDTGGLEPESEEIIPLNIRRQAEIAIETADVILFVVDGLDGVTATDRDIADILRRSGKEVLLVCNKIDSKKSSDHIFEFYELGIGEPLLVSAEQGLGIGDLLDEIIKHFPEHKDTDYHEDIIKVAVIGKPNVGKSSLINNILGEDRVIVTDIPGTTRDAIDTYFTYDEDRYLFIDTAGLRRKRSIYENVERYSVVRTLTAVDRSDICILVIDGTEGITEQDTKIAGYAYEQGKGMIIAVNKWDIVEKETNTPRDMEREIRNKLGFITYAPIVFISAKTGKRVNKLFELIKIVNNNYEVTLLDSLRKRIDFLAEVKKELEFDNIELIHGRAEDFGQNKNYREKFDICVSRAVAPLNVLSEYCLPFVKKGGYFAAYKSENISQEILSSENAVKKLGGKIREVKEINLPGTDIVRKIVIIEKCEPTNLKYPRKAGKPSKDPLV